MYRKDCGRGGGAGERGADRARERTRDFWRSESTIKTLRRLLGKSVRAFEGVFPTTAAASANDGFDGT